MSSVRTIERLLRQQASLARFGSFAFGETDLQKILDEAVRICAESLHVPFCKICRHRPEHGDLLIVAGHGWKRDVVGRVISRADDTSTQGRAFVTGEPVILEDVRENNSYELPPFYADHGIVSTADVLVKGTSGPFGVLEVDCTVRHTFDEHDVNFLTGFANVVAEAVGTAERAAILRSTLVELQRISDEKDVFAAELQHRVRNNLQLVYGMLVREIEMPKDDIREGLRAIARRVMSLARIYDHLLGHGLVQTIDFGAYLDSLCISLQDFQTKPEFKIELVCETAPMALGLDAVTALGIIVTEITSNAYLHAFPSRPGTIRVVLTREEDTGVLAISDDGVGFAPQVASKRRGVGLVKRLIEQEQGTAKLDSAHGTAWTLTFPVPAVGVTSAGLALP